MNEIQSHFSCIKPYSKEIQRMNVVIIFPWYRTSAIHGRERWLFNFKQLLSLIFVCNDTTVLQTSGPTHTHFYRIRHTRCQVAWHVSIISKWGKTTAWQHETTRKTSTLFCHSMTNSRYRWLVRPPFPLWCIASLDRVAPKSSIPLLFKTFPKCFNSHLEIHPNGIPCFEEISSKPKSTFKFKSIQIYK